MLNWKELDTLEMVHQIKHASEDTDILIFKHSTTCSISQMAKLRLESQWDDQLDLVPYYLDVKKYREISNEVADVFSVHHESPQVLLVRNGECLYDASHFDISVKELKETLQWHAGS